MFRIDSKGEISPSSTLDLLPTSTASHVTRRRASSAHHTLEIRPNDGTVVAYGASALEEEGDNFLAHLGIGDEWGQRVVQPKPVRGITQCIEVAAGDLHSLFLCGDGVVFSVGGGWEGVLGHNDESSLAIPRPIASLPVRIARIAAGGAHSLAVGYDGYAYSWGWGGCGQLGHGADGDGGVVSKQLAPKRVEGLEEVKQVAAGKAHSIVLCTNGAVYSFGRNNKGQCGIHDTSSGQQQQMDNIRVPTRITTLDKACEVMAHGDVSAAAVMSADEETGFPEEELYMFGDCRGVYPVRVTAEAVAKAMRLII